MAPPILSYENLGLHQGEGWLFKGIDVHVGPRDRLALIGRNGAGKTTLLKCLGGTIETDLGKRMIERNALCRVEWLASISDKPTRGRSFQAMCSMGRVIFPRRAPWKADVLGQLFRFPAGKYDDAVDVCSLFGRGLMFIGSPKAKKKSLGDQHTHASWMAS